VVRLHLRRGIVGRLLLACGICVTLAGSSNHGAADSADGSAFSGIAGDGSDHGSARGALCGTTNPSAPGLRSILGGVLLCCLHLRGGDSSRNPKCRG